MADNNIVLHPQRYPTHDGDKGQVFDGECNTTRCTNHGAVWFNRATYGYYCTTNAHGINEFTTDGEVPCVQVDHQLSRAEMDSMVDEMNQSMRKNREK